MVGAIIQDMQEHQMVLFLKVTYSFYVAVQFCLALSSKICLLDKAILLKC